MRDKLVNDIILNLSKFLRSRKTKILFLANSNNSNNCEISISQLKELDKYYYTYIVVDSVSILERFLKHPKLEYHYLFADTETKKFEISVFQAIKDFDNRSIIGFQPSDILINTSRKLITEILYKYPKANNVLVKGIGKIGFRIIQLLNDFGLNVFLETSELKKNIINDTINEFGYNQLKIDHFNKNSTLDIIIGCSNGQVVIDSDYIQFTTLNSIIIDIGIGTVSDSLIESDLKIIRVSPRIELENLILEFNFHKKELLNFSERKKVNDFWITKEGTLGKKGDLIFEDLDPASRFIGIANGKGGLISNEESIKIYNQFFKNE
ncbi:hypothetical protein OAA74_02755 [Flavobacteriaceae bacterium]|nr:hypothetical protein [Flavobacteriaceae bacterium]